jgi:putative ABC transport system permease protein
VKHSERELEDELRFDLERRIEANLAAGMSRKEAEMAARREFGSVDLAKEECRDERGTRWLEDLWQDIRFGLRMLRKNPGFTAVAVLTLALGIGANTAIFSVVSAVLLRPLPYPNDRQLVHIQEKHAGGSGVHFTFASYLDLERNSKTIENVAAYRPWTFNLTGNGEPEQVFGAQVSAHFFSALGTQPALGRLIDAADNQPGGDNRVAVLSHALWQSHFGGDREIIGKTTEVNRERYTVIGVMPPNFHLPDYAKLWCPLVPEGELRPNRRSHLLTAIGDLRRGELLTAVQSEMQAIAAQIEDQNPGIDPGLTINTVSLKDSIVAPVRPVLMTLSIAVGLLLLIACANVANLMLARGATRSKEIATRLALGAGRVRIACQLLTESALVGLLGGVVGFCVAWWGLRFIVALNGDFPRFGEIHLDWRVLEFTLLLSIVTAVFFGLAPAVASLKLDLNASLKERVPSSHGASRRGISQPLVALQFALAMVLLVGASLLGHSFLRLLNVSPGFNTENLLTMQIFLPPVEFPEGDPKGAVVMKQVLERVRALPGARSVGLVSTLPISGGPDTDFVIQGRPAPPPKDEPEADIRIIDPEYFHVMKIPLRAGREFTEADSYQSARVMIINQTMAREFWPNESPLGQRVTMEDWGPPLTGEVIGVVGDTKSEGLDAEARPMIYWPYTQFPQNFNAFVIRSDGDPWRWLER